MITYEEARSIVEKEITQMNALPYATQVTLLETYEQTPFLWIFFYQSTEYLKTARMELMIGGNSPFMIAKLDGSMAQYATCYSEEQMIELYEEENHIWQLIMADDSYSDMKKVMRLRKVLGWTMQELDERRKQKNYLIASGGQEKLLPIQQTLKRNDIQSEIVVSEKYRVLV